MASAHMSLESFAGASASSAGSAACIKAEAMLSTSHLACHKNDGELAKD